MIRIDTKGFDELGEMLAHLREDLPKATAMTLTFMGQAAKKAAEDAILKKFDRPTPWIQKSIYLRAASVADLSAVVFVKDESINALAHHIDGGKRRAKGMEKLLRLAGVLKGSHQYIVPGRGMKLDAFGNIPRGEVNKILSALKAQSDRINNSGRNVDAWKRNKNQSRYFVVTDLKSIVTKNRLHPGVYYRGGNGAKTYIKPMLIFVKSTMYRSRWDFFQFTEDAAADAMEPSVDKAIDILRARGRWWL
jgi:hypothetical protein